MSSHRSSGPAPLLERLPWRSLGVYALVLFGLGWLPLLGGPRYEAALLAGLLGPTWAGVTIGAARARSLHAWRLLALQDGVRRSRELSVWFRRSLVEGAAFAVVTLGVAALHALISGACEPLPGFALLLLGPGIGILLGASTGCFAALLGITRARTRWGRRYLLLVPAVALASAGWAVAQFYGTPTVRLYDHFAGYFAGPVYDAVDYRLPSLLAFRVTSVLMLFGLAQLVAGRRIVVEASSSCRITSSAEGKLRLAAGALGLLIFAFGLGLSLLGGPQFGQSVGAARLKQELGRVTRAGPCSVHFSTSVTAEAARTVAWECRGHLSQHARYFDVELPDEVTVFLFATTEEKREWMGAAQTNIAKPWRREVYVTNQGFPHPILGHELAHVVAGSFGRGPFAVAGALGGLVMDPGRVEGFAEAAAPRETSHGTLAEWAAAMKKVDRLPPLTSLFQLGFFGTSAARSYTAAGAFVEFLHSKYGPATLKGWYRGSALPHLTSSSWRQMEVAWHEHLDAVDVPEPVLALATPRFSRPGVFEQRCPHALERKLISFGKACGASSQRAEALVEEVISLDARRVDLRLDLPRCMAAEGQHEDAIRSLEDELTTGAGYEPHERQRALEFLGDEGFWLGDVDAARAAYEQSLELTFDPHERRQIEAKLWSIGQEPPVFEFMRQLLAAPTDSGWSREGLLAEWLSRGREAGHEDVARYLLARVAVAAQNWAEAEHFLGATAIERLPLESMKKEATRLRLLTACYQQRSVAPRVVDASVTGASASDVEASPPGGRGQVAGQPRDRALAEALESWLSHRSSAADEVHARHFVERCEVGR